MLNKHLKVYRTDMTCGAIAMIANQARHCTGREEHSDDGGPNDIGLAQRLIKMEHWTPFEFVHITFDIHNISLVCLAQLVRHRLASYAVKSRRYTKVSSEERDQCITPPAIEQNKEAYEIYWQSIITSFDAYNAMLDRGILPEDARYVLPQCIPTRLGVSFNLREFLQVICPLRMHSKAQWEIREMVGNMLDLVEDTTPTMKLFIGFYKKTYLQKRLKGEGDDSIVLRKLQDIIETSLGGRDV